MTDKELITEARKVERHTRTTLDTTVADFVRDLADALEARSQAYTELNADYDAMKARAEIEPEWEYRAKVEWIDPYDPRRHPNYYLSRRKPFTDAELEAPVAVDDMTGENTLDGCYLEAQECRRPADPWLPVEGESA